MQSPSEEGYAVYSNQRFLVLLMVFLPVDLVFQFLFGPFPPFFQSFVHICPWNAIPAFLLIACGLNNLPMHVVGRHLLSASALIITSLHWGLQFLQPPSVLPSEMMVAMGLSIMSLLFLVRNQLKPWLEIGLFFAWMVLSLAASLYWIWAVPSGTWLKAMPDYSLLDAVIFLFLSWIGLNQSKILLKFGNQLERSGARHLIRRLLIGFPGLFFIYGFGLLVLLSLFPMTIGILYVSALTAILVMGALMLVYVDANRVVRSELARSQLLKMANERLELAVEELTKEQALTKKVNEDLNEALNIQSGNLQEAVAELNSQRLKTKAAFDVKSRFLSNVSHELRGPLSAISTLAGLIRESSQEGTLKSLSEKLGLATFHLNGLVSDILDLNKLELGKVHLNLEPLRLTDHIDRLLDWVNPLARDKGLSIRFTKGRDEKITVMADALRLRQILINLINNAIKFTTIGGVEVGFEVLAQTAKQCKLKIFVRDTGPGIDPERVRTIFNPFEQETLQIEREFGGSGLGLAIVKDMVELMGGKVEVFSEVGRGSSFEVTLPFDRVQEDLDTGAAYSVYLDSYDNADPETLTKPLTELKGRKVLLVDDIKLNQEVSTWMLESAGCEVVCASGGWEALDLLNKQSFDLILMDLHMPEINGAETTRLLRLNPRFAQTLVVGLSGASREEDIRLCIESGMNEHMTKPIQPKKLVHMWHEHHRSRDGGDDGQT